MPFAKILLEQIPPVMLAGLLYCGSGIGLLSWLLIRKIFFNGNNKEANLTRQDMPWLAGAIAAGGIAAPVLLMFGINIISASSASLLLNLQVFLIFCTESDHFFIRDVPLVSFIITNPN